MKTISAVMPVYNEEALLEATLKNIYPYVDEIVVVDGGPDGKSTDGTAEIAKACDKVKYCEGVYTTLDGAWDSPSQRNHGILEATGDVILPISADVMFLGLDYLREAIAEEKYKVFFCTALEFWCDINHLRLQDDNTASLTMQSSAVSAMAIDLSLKPHYGEDFQLQTDRIVAPDRKIFPQVFKFHLGFIRPFAQQVEKHIRHIRQHRWGDIGEKLMRGAERGLAQWAILHVLGYSDMPKIAWAGAMPGELQECKNMTYNYGAQEVIAKFESDYGVSLLRAGGVK